MNPERERNADRQGDLERRHFIALLASCAAALRTRNWSQAERQRQIDAMAPFAGPDLEFYKR